jgi:hypothetical protein
VRLAIDACHELNGKKTYEDVALQLVRMVYKTWMDHKIVYVEKRV